MPYDARVIANIILDRAESTNASISHLSLQKILYFAHAWHLVKYNEPLIGQPFEAWKYGPVVRVVYDQLKGTRQKLEGKRLTKFDAQSGEKQTASAAVDLEKVNLIKDIVDYYGRFHSGALVDLTHEVDGPWDRVWKKAEERAVLGMYIPDDLIKESMIREGGAIVDRSH